MMTNRGSGCPMCRQPKKAGQETVPGGSKPTSLLVIEDDIVDAQGIERILKESSLSVSDISLAASLAEALAHIGRGIPDVILLDLGLADSSGLDSIAALLRLAPETPIIVLTGLEDDRMVVSAVQKGAQDYLNKSCLNICTLPRAIRCAIERKEHGRQLRAAEKRYRTIFDNCAVAIMMFDDRDRLVSWNRVTEDLFGMGREDLYHRQAKTLCPEERRRELDTHDASGDDTSRHLETKVTRKTGEVIDVDVSWSMLSEARNGVEGSICVVRDITHRKLAEAKLKEAMEEAERINEELTEATARANDLAAQAEIANAAKTWFLANMTHEIRTPMNAVIGFSDILADLPLEPEHKECAEIIRESGRHLVTLIDDILDLSRIEAGRLGVEPVDCELAAVMEAVGAMMRVLVEKKGLQFNVVMDSNLPRIVRTDPLRLRQCLMNLISNAIKFTPTGYVRVRVSLEGDESAPDLRFDIEDSGVGIPKEKQQSIFDAFTQLDTSTAQRYEGIGLGLTITRSLAELLGGSLMLQSDQEQGSVFSLRVPARVDVCETDSTIGRAPIRTSYAKKAPSPDSMYTGHVLVAEDVPTNQRLLQLILERIGLKVTVVENGDRAVEEATSRSFDLILMDVQMPGQNGLDATRELRLKGMSIPIVALTAHIMREDRQECINAGCNAYLSKPIDRGELIQVIERYLPRQDNASGDHPRSSTTGGVPSRKRHVIPAAATGTSVSDRTDIINWGQLISRIVDEQLVEDIMPICVQDNKKRLELLAQAVSAAKIGDVRLYAHAIKGSMMNVGANRLSQMARSLEHAAGKGDLSDAEEHLTRIRKEFERFEALVSRPDWIEVVKQGEGDGRTEAASHLLPETRSLDAMLPSLRQ